MRMRTMRISRVAVLGVVALLGTVHARAADDWEWELTPYLWATDAGADISVNDSTVASSEVPFSDLVDKLEIGFMGHAEARRGRHGLFGDVFFVSLSEDDKPFPSGVASAEFDMTLLELGGVFNPNAGGRGFSLLYGARMFDRGLDIDARFQLGPGPTVDRHYESDETLVDALVGVRYVGAFAERWSYLVGADASAGGTNLSWSAGAGVFWGFGENQRYAVALGYRHLDIDFDPDQGAAEVDVEMTLSGFMAGVRFSF